MASRIPTALRELSAILRKLRELGEWAKLEQQERRPHEPPSFQPRSHLAEDFRIQYTAFISLAMDIQEALNHPGLEASQRERRRWRRRLRELEDQLHTLDVAERFINP